MKMPRHGGQLRALAEQLGLKPEELLDFSANINPDGPPSGVREALRHAIEQDTTVTLYPDLEETALRQAIGCYLDVRSEAVFVANGFGPLLRAAVETLGVRRCLLAVPCFNEYRRTLEQAGVDVVPMLLSADDGFAYDTAAILKAARESGCDTLLLANPQNPSGVLCGRAAMLELTENAAELGIRVLVDEAFIDYMPEESLVAEAETLRTLVVFRSVTKFFALPGLRVAYGVASRSCAASIRAGIPSWSITTLASIGVMAALGESAYGADARRKNLIRRQRLGEALQSLEARVFDGRANFLLFRLKAPPELWKRMIVEHGIVLRACSDYEGLRYDGSGYEGPRSESAGAHFYRIAVRSEDDTLRLLEALRTQLRH